MPRIVIEVKGLKELERAFSQAPQVVEREIDRAMKRSVQRVQTDVKMMTPVDTGRLRGSISGTVEGQGAAKTGTVGTRVFYAPFVEFGTKYMKPRSMFRKAFEKNVEWIQEEFTKVAERVVDAIAGRM